MLQFILPVLCILAASDLPRLVKSHGRLMEPPNRSSIWRFPEFSKYSPPINYDDNSLFCGGISEQYVKNGGNCGPCGDSFEDNVPRANENTGQYGRGIVVRQYTFGQKIPIAVELTRSHLGYFVFQLCYLKNPKSPEDEACFIGNELQLADGTGTNYEIKTWDIGYFNTSVILPSKIGPSGRYVLRWHYRTGNSWGDCGDGTGKLGCGNQEIFRSCADISISLSVKG